MANDYICRRVDLGTLDEYIHAHIDESLQLDATGRPDALLFGFVQVRIYEMHDGLPEDELRKDVADYLAEHGLLRPPAPRRATG